MRRHRVLKVRQREVRRPRIGRRAAFALAAAVSISACRDGGRTNGPNASAGPTTSTGPIATSGTTGADPSATSGTTDGGAGETLPTLLPLAPDSDRVDRETPTFSDPTRIDNPLFPISELHSAVLVGNNEGRPIKIETTLMPEHEIVEVDGRRIETLESQFISFEDGRIHEVATDWYAQGDDGAVYYLGEDVFNYEDGVVADTEGTWRAGRDGPVAMIMPADPQPGDVFRPENIPGVLMEEVTVRRLDVMVDGPHGPVDGAIVAEENHTLEGVYEDKWFAPGYGEFFSGVGDSLERLAIGVPTGALEGPVPSELTRLYDAAIEIFDAAASGEWHRAALGLDTLRAAWTAFRGRVDVPPMLAVQMDRALARLAGDAMVPAVDDRNAEGSRNAAIAVAQADLDLQLQYRPPVEIDRGRFQLWARQLEADASRIEVVPGFLAGDVTTLEWLWQRFAPTVDEASAAAIESELVELRRAVDDEDTAAVTDASPALLEAALALG
jgi:hypothetical protein